jgi:hypothetical protein
MQINISREMAMAVIDALKAHIWEYGPEDFGHDDDYKVSNEDALAFFEEILKNDY